MSRNRNLALLEQLVAKFAEVLKAVLHLGQPGFPNLLLTLSDKSLHSHGRLAFLDEHAAIIARKKDGAPPLLDY